VKVGRVEELNRASQQVLKSQPFSVLIGAKLASFSEREAVIEVPVARGCSSSTGSSTAAPSATCRTLPGFDGSLCQVISGV
jgi:hypothetical protein